MRVLITGGTGFLGRPVVGRLIQGGHQVRVLSRNPGSAGGKLPKEAEASAWKSPEPLPAAALRGVDAVCLLAGENVGRWPWNEELKRSFRASRIDATRAVIASLAALPAGERPKALVSASAVGYYGDAGEAWRREGDAPGRGFLAELVRDWEAEVFQAEALGMRVAALRLGVVLGDGGALAKMLTPFRLGAGAVVGSGRQYLSWVHRADAAEAIVFALQNESARGPLNVAAPEPATNRDFSRTLARAVHRPLLFRAPAFVLSAVLGEMARETLLAGQRVSSEKLASLGYRFRYPGLEGALQDILEQRRKRK